MMIMWCRVGFAFLFSLLVGLPAFGQKWAEEMFEQTEHDFGSVAQGAKAEFEFVLSNIYVEDVHIASVRSSCGCTSPRIAKQSLKTYEKGAIIAAFNTHSFLGKKAATITVTFDRPYRAEVQLSVTGRVRANLVLDPGSAQLGSVDQGTPADARLSLSHTGRDDWKILEVHSDSPHLSATVVETTRSTGQVSCELLVHLDEHAPVGYVSDHLLLVTNDRQQTQVPVRVEGQVVPAVAVNPASLFMGSVQPGDTVTKQLVVRGKQPFRILAIDCDNDCFTFGAPADELPKALHVVPVTYVANGGAGKVTGTIRIETDWGGAAPELAAYAVVLAP
jgi:hypothetical protein